MKKIEMSFIFFTVNIIYLFDIENDRLRNYYYYLTAKAVKMAVLRKF